MVLKLIAIYRGLKVAYKGWQRVRQLRKLLDKSSRKEHLTPLGFLLKWGDR